MEDIRAEVPGMPCDGGKRRSWDGSMLPTKNLFLAFSQLTQSLHGNSENSRLCFINSLKITELEGGFKYKNCHYYLFRKGGL